MPDASQLIVWSVFFPIVGAILLSLISEKSDRLRNTMSFFISIVTAASVIFILLAVLNGRTPEFSVPVSYTHLDVYKRQHLIWVTMAFFVVGFGIKSALFPLHLWLPDAHSSAPSPSSAILSGLVVKAYIVSLFKVFTIVFGIELFLETTNIRALILIMATAAILAGSFFAFVQLELKRRLAYSTVAQVGYVFLGIGLEMCIRDSCRKPRAKNSPCTWGGVPACSCAGTAYSRLFPW